MLCKQEAAETSLTSRCFRDVASKAQLYFFSFSRLSAGPKGLNAQYPPPQRFALA